jgi:hypothetical protein
MLVKVVSSKHITLKPENDSDEALLNMWSDMKCVLGGSSHHVGDNGLKTTSVRITWLPREKGETK